MWPESLWTPAIFGRVDSAIASFILEHQPHYASFFFWFFFDFGSQKRYCCVNFFEASIASSLALLGCWLRGIIFRQPCRCNT